MRQVAHKLTMLERSAVRGSWVLILTLSATPAFSQAANRVGVALTSERPTTPASGSITSSPGASAEAMPADAKKRSTIVRRVVIDGNFPELQSAVAARIGGVEGRNVTLADAYALAAGIQQAYADAGYPLVRAAVDSDAFARGEIRIRIIDGFIEDIDLNGVPAELRALVGARLRPIVGRRHLRQSEFQRHILLIGELSGVNGVSKTRTGRLPGGLVLVVDATLTPFTSTTGVNNILPSYSGTYLFTQGFSINNTFGFGENIHAEVGSSPDMGRYFSGGSQTQFFNLAGSVPVGADGLVLSAGYFQSRGTPTTPSGVFLYPAESENGVFQRASARATYPVFLSLQHTVRLQLGFDYVDDFSYAFPYPVRLYTGPISNLVYHDQYEDLRLAGEWKFNFPWAWGGSLISAAIYNHGVGGIGGTIFEPLSRPGSSPQFDKLKGEIRLQQPLPENFIFAALGRGQTSFGRSLMLPEELVLDGPDALSGFGAGTLLVDTGAVGRAELQHPFAVPLSGSTIISSPYIFGAIGGGQLEEVVPGQNANIHATSFGLGVRNSGKITGWPFNETLNLEFAHVDSNVRYAREGYAFTFIYSMTYSDDPFANARPGLVRVDERRTADFRSSGFYGGLNSGYAIDGSSKIASKGYVASNALDTAFGANAAPVSAANITGSAPTSDGTPIGGAQVGYNYAAGNWVLGAEADIQGGGQETFTSSSRAAIATVGGEPETVTTLLDGRKAVDWMGTIRGRVGVAATPSLLTYVTGGLAYGGVSADSRALQNWSDPPGSASVGPLAALASSSAASGAYSNMMVGWTLGGGLEWMFAPGLSLKGEMLYYDLGKGNFTSGTLTTRAFGFSNDVTSGSSVRYDGYVFRLGLNFHFGAPEEQPSRVVKGPAETSKPAWNGFYAGLNAGYAWGVGSMASNSAAVGQTNLDQQLSSAGTPIYLATATAQDIVGQSKTAPFGYIGGGQVGYNAQLNRGVLGLEADLQGAGAKGHDDYTTRANFVTQTPPAPFASLDTHVSNTAALNWLGTVRARGGMFVRPDLLAYATGGLAYGETSSSTSIDQQWSGTPFGDLLKTSGSAGATNKLTAGYALGAGLEWLFSRNLSMKAEYLYYDLGVVSYASSPSMTTGLGLSNSALPITHIHFDGQTVRLGLNYHFDTLSSPIFDSAGY